ncbi:MAG TPA: PaaI family thioesterase [Gemmatales bacterium]|nr:PaaI family thioesterase [Gemmatales bacterium]
MTPAEQTLQPWLEEETLQQARLAAGPGPGIARLEEVLPLTGLEYIQGVVTGKLPYPWMARTLDFHIMAASDGRVVFQGAPQLQHTNPMGTIHGGWFASILDSAMACAVHTKLPVGRSYTTAELSINLVKALTPQIVRVRAEAQVLHFGRQLATAEGKLFGPDGTLYAHGTTTCLVFETRVPAR